MNYIEIIVMCIDPKEHLGIVRQISDGVTKELYRGEYRPTHWGAYQDLDACIAMARSMTAQRIVKPVYKWELPHGETYRVRDYEPSKESHSYQV